MFFDSPTSSILHPRYSLLASRYSLLATRYSLLATRYSQLATRYSQLATCNSQLATRYSQLLPLPTTAVTRTMPDPSNLVGVTSYEAELVYGSPFIFDGSSLGPLRWIPGLGLPSHPFQAVLEAPFPRRALTPNPIFQTICWPRSVVCFWSSNQERQT